MCARLAAAFRRARARRRRPWGAPYLTSTTQLKWPLPVSRVDLARPQYDRARALRLRPGHRRLYPLAPSICTSILSSSPSFRPLYSRPPSPSSSYKSAGSPEERALWSGARTDGDRRKAGRFCRPQSTSRSITSGGVSKFIFFFFRNLMDDPIPSLFRYALHACARTRH
jgi:hypothetical protein